MLKINIVDLHLSVCVCVRWGGGGGGGGGERVHGTLCFVGK